MLDWRRNKAGNGCWRLRLLHLLDWRRNKARIGGGCACRKRLMRLRGLLDGRRNRARIGGGCARRKRLMHLRGLLDSLVAENEQDDEDALVERLPDLLVPRASTA